MCLANNIARSQLYALDETLRSAWGAKTCFTPVALALADGRKQNLSYLLRQVNTECSPLGRARRSHLLGSSDANASQHLSLPRTEIQKFTSLSSRPLHPSSSTRTALLVRRQSSLSQHGTEAARLNTTRDLRMRQKTLDLDAHPESVSPKRHRPTWPEQDAPASCRFGINNCHDNVSTVIYIL